MSYKLVFFQKQIYLNQENPFGTLTFPWINYNFYCTRCVVLAFQAHKLHEELGEKRAMEYRLRAFTGDDFVLNSRYYKNNR